MWENELIDKQLSLSFFNDELAQVRTKKKEFLMQADRTHRSLGRMGRYHPTVLLQRRARQ